MRGSGRGGRGRSGRRGRRGEGEREPRRCCWRAVRRGREVSQRGWGEMRREIVNRGASRRRRRVRTPTRQAPRPAHGLIGERAKKFISHVRARAREAGFIIHETRLHSSQDLTGHFRSSRSRLANSTWASAPYTASRVRVDSTLTRDTHFHTETSCRSTRTLCSCYLKYGSSRAQSGSAQPHADLLHGTFTLPTRYFKQGVRRPRTSERVHRKIATPAIPMKDSATARKQPHHL